MASTTYPRGFTPVERAPDKLKPKHPTNPPALSVEELLATIPETAVVKAAREYLEPKLPKNVWNHSQRAYLYGVAIAKVQFPDWTYDPESFYLACLFHDLGAIPESIKATKLSFEFYGAFLARSWLLPDAEKASQDEKDIADSVTETVARHTNFIDGRCSTHVQLIQLGTLFDNIGAQASWVAAETVDQVVAKYPRLEWTCGFHDAMKMEVEAKPWSHTTFFNEAEVWDQVLENKIAAPIEEREAKST
ncbi:cyanamide hydratase [Leucosporidium creatinivorum]|uniref:Cyanamide hydratase n=1 Tax=Leucosporidium creatinivorum TaxID=106004 RepID=A0A1Y2DC22_9BASI|nr:cyanamide hydratase [Leucosporidium creatinivorum]